jgi:hypothetical protein
VELDNPKHVILNLPWRLSLQTNGSRSPITGFPHPRSNGIKQGNIVCRLVRAYGALVKTESFFNREPPILDTRYGYVRHWLSAYQTLLGAGGADQPGSGEREAEMVSLGSSVWARSRSFRHYPAVAARRVEAIAGQADSVCAQSLISGHLASSPASISRACGATAGCCDFKKRCVV